MLVLLMLALLLPSVAPECTLEQLTELLEDTHCIDESIGLPEHCSYNWTDGTTPPNASPPTWVTTTTAEKPSSTSSSSTSTSTTTTTSATSSTPSTSTSTTTATSTTTTRVTTTAAISAELELLDMLEKYDGCLDQTSEALKPCLDLLFPTTTMTTKSMKYTLTSTQPLTSTSVSKTTTERQTKPISTGEITSETTIKPTSTAASSTSASSKLATSEKMTTVIPTAATVRETNTGKRETTAAPQATSEHSSTDSSSNTTPKVSTDSTKHSHEHTTSPTETPSASSSTSVSQSSYSTSNVPGSSPTSVGIFSTLTAIAVPFPSSSPSTGISKSTSADVLPSSTSTIETGSISHASTTAAVTETKTSLVNERSSTASSTEVIPTTISTTFTADLTTTDLSSTEQSTFTSHGPSREFPTTTEGTTNPPSTGSESSSAAVTAHQTTSGAFTASPKSQLTSTSTSDATEKTKSASSTSETTYSTSSSSTPTYAETSSPQTSATLTSDNPSSMGQESSDTVSTIAKTPMATTTPPIPATTSTTAAISNTPTTTPTATTRTTRDSTSSSGSSAGSTASVAQSSTAQPGTTIIASTSVNFETTSGKPSTGVTIFYSSTSTKQPLTVTNRVVSVPERPETSAGATTKFHQTTAIPSEPSTVTLSTLSSSSTTTTAPAATTSTVAEKIQSGSSISTSTLTSSKPTTSASTTTTTTAHVAETSQMASSATPSTTTMTPASTTTSVTASSQMPKDSTSTEIQSTSSTSPSSSAGLTSANFKLGITSVTLSSTPFPIDYDDNTNTTATTETMNCSEACPPGYVEGSSCFQFLLPAESYSYQRALSVCRGIDAQDMAGIQSFRNARNLAIFQQWSSSQELALFYINEDGSQQVRTSRVVRILDIFNQTQFSTVVANNLSVSAHSVNVSAACALPKYCGVPSCPVELLLQLLGLTKTLTADTPTLTLGEKTEIRCPDGTPTTVQCVDPGQLLPHPTLIACGVLPTQPLGDEQKVVMNCGECFELGTANCSPSNLTDGVDCLCKHGWTGTTCWLSPNLCANVSCGPHGKCQTLVDYKVCICDFGYSGDKCEVNRDPSSKFNGTVSFLKRFDLLDASSVAAIEVTFWTVASIVMKTMGKVIIANDEDDPQETYQTLRSMILTFATLCVLFFHNPFFLNISSASCRIYFLIIHFCYAMAMMQWTFEGLNANEVIRARHKNKWEKDFKGRRRFFYGAVARLIPSFVVISTVFIIMYNANWQNAASTWTCLGVVCELTTSMWLPVGYCLICIGLLATAYAENSYYVMRHRPLLRLKIRYDMEQKDGFELSQNSEKCIRNVTWTLVGSWILIVCWVATVLSADQTKSVFLGLLSLGLAITYCLISIVQGIITCPSTYKVFMHALMKWAPPFFAPTFESVTFWTREEKLEAKRIKKSGENTAEYDSFADPTSEDYIPVNCHEYMEHRWQQKGAALILSGSTHDELYVKLLADELYALRDTNASHLRDVQVMNLFTLWKAKAETTDDYFKYWFKSNFEKVTMPTIDDDGNVQMTEFYIKPYFLTFRIPKERLEEDAFVASVRRMLPSSSAEGSETPPIDEKSFIRRCYLAVRQEAAEHVKFVDAATRNFPW